MQIVTLNYQYNPKGNFHRDARSKFQHRHILTTIRNPQKKSKQQQRSFLPDLKTRSTAPLPSIKTSRKRPNSIRIKGNGLTSSKFNEISISSFRQPSRSRSRQSEKSDILGTRSRSTTPSGVIRPIPKLVHLKFGYPVTIRSSDFYASDLTESELRFREESFVNDSIRAATQNIRSSKAPHYDPLNDPNLKYFFQSPSILDVVHKTLSIDLAERLSDVKKSNRRDKAYHRIVAKHSSGYGKLNGYDCIPSFAPIHHHRRITHDRHRSSANTSLTSMPTYHSFPNQQKPTSRQNTKSTKLNPLSHPTALTNNTAAISSRSQDQD